MKLQNFKDYENNSSIANINFLTGIKGYSQQKTKAEYTGVEYIQLKSDLTRG